MIEYNLEVANELILGTVNSDDIAIALHLMGWKIVQIDGDDRQSDVGTAPAQPAVGREQVEAAP